MPDCTRNLIMVTGPSGSGKSTITERLHQRLGGDWLLWQVDRCSPIQHAAPRNLTREQGLALDARMFAANIAAIAAYLNNGWPVVAELAVMTTAEADAVQKIGADRTILVQLSCSAETLASHLRQRDTPVPMEWAIGFYEHWRGVHLPGAIQMDVDGIAATQVVDQLLQRWTTAEA